MPIEVEIRSFITKEKYLELLEFFKKSAKFVKEENDETEYYADQGSVRIRKSRDSAKLVLKSGDIHDEYREEHEINIKKEEFALLQNMFKKLGVGKQVRWERRKNTFNWDGITVELGDNKGYGFIIELEKITDDAGKEEALKVLKEKLSSLNIPLTPKEKFKEAYENYKENWKSLIGEK